MTDTQLSITQNMLSDQNKKVRRLEEENTDLRMLLAILLDRTDGKTEVFEKVLQNVRNEKRTIHSQKNLKNRSIMYWIENEPKT